MRMFEPKTKTEFRKFIKEASISQLHKAGFQTFTTYYHEKNNAKTNYLKPNEKHLLVPQRFYNIIPEGFQLICISGKKHSFSCNKSDDDARFGCLPYGIIRK